MGKNLKFCYVSTVYAQIVLYRKLSSNQRVSKNFYYFNIVAKNLVESYWKKNK